MKLRLPLALLAAAISVVAEHANSATLYAGKIYRVEADKTETWNDYSQIENCGTDNPFVKDGDGVLSFQNVQQTNKYDFPIIAREGKIKFADSYVVANASLSKALPGYVTSWLNVGGKNAELELSNSVFTTVGEEVDMNVGTPDGSGTLTITNKSKVGTSANSGIRSLWVGSHAFDNNEDGYGLGYLTSYNGTAMNEVTTYETPNVKSVEDRYTEGTYIDAIDNYADRRFAQAVINVTDESELNVRTCLTIGAATINIGKKSVVTTQIGYGGSVVTNDSAYCVIMGRWSGAKSVINITEGGKMITYGDLRTERSNSNVSNTISQILVSGDKSELEVKAEARFGESQGTNNKTIVEATEGGTLTLAKATLGIKNGNNDVSIRIDSKSNYVGNELILNNKGVKFNNEGKTTVNKLDINGGTVENSGLITGIALFATGESDSDVITLSADGELINTGTIEKDIVMDGGSLTLKQNSSIAALKATGGTVQITGDIDAWGNIALSNTEFIFADGAEIDLNGYNFTLTDSNIVITLSDEELSEISGITFVHAGNIEGLVGKDVTLTTADGSITGTYTLTSNDVVIKNIPEPATATLSLLAIAALAARRRRK